MRSSEVIQRFQTEYEQRPALFGREPSSLVVEAHRMVTGRSESRALDIGCGHGRDSIFLLEAGFEVVAIDGAQSGLVSLQSQASELGLESSLSTVCADLSCDPLRPYKRQFDLVVMITVLDHLTDEAAIQGLIAWANLAAKSDGIIAVQSHSTADPGHGALASDDREPLPESEFAGVLGHFFEPGELLDRFETAGCRVIRYDEWTETDTDHGPVHDHGFVGGLFRPSSVSS